MKMMIKKKRTTTMMNMVMIRMIMTKMIVKTMIMMMVAGCELHQSRQGASLRQPGAGS